MNRRALPLIAAFVAVVVIANWITASLGVVTWLGLTATAGTWIAGFGFVVRDSLHDAAGRRWVVAAIAIGAVLSAALSPQLALASATAFLISELADFAVYTPLRSCNRVGAALLSNTVGAILDTIIFLAIAGFPLSLTPTQVLIKVGTTTVFVAAVALITRNRTREAIA